MWTILITVGMSLLLPLAFILSLAFVKFNTKLEWLLDALATSLLVTWSVLSGPWSWFNRYVGYLYIVLLIGALVYSWMRSRPLPFAKTYTSNQKMSIGVYVFLVLIFGYYNLGILSSYSTKDAAIELDFPLTEGTYHIGHGGSHTIMNYHQEYAPQQYALDIVALNRFGVRASGLYPKELEKYEIYGHPISSPCNGVVVEVKDGLIDLQPPEMDPENATGNYVALTCDVDENTVIYLAHMQEGSLAVEEGTRVEVGQLLGKVGNTGNTSEPHLHIHAEKDGVGIPLTFQERFLVRNQLVRP